MSGFELSKRFAVSEGAAVELLRSLTDWRATFELARRTYARRLAPNFDLFDFVEPGEIKLSRILAWMLNPAGSHAQGSRFLAEFLRELDLDWPVADVARVAVEVRTDEGRRVDIVVRMPCGVVGIENKPFDVDRTGQVSDYLAWLEKQSGQRCLVYLAGLEGAMPNKRSIGGTERLRREAKGEFKAISYPALLPWIDRCRAASEAHTVSAFLEAFARYIRSQFTGAKDMTERDHLVQVTLRSPDNLRSAMQLIAAAASVRTAVMDAFKEGIRAALPPGYALKSFDATEEKYTGLRITMPGVQDADFAVSFEGAQFTWLIYGICRHHDGYSDSGMKHLLDEALGIGIQTETWPWYRRASIDERTFPVAGDWRLAEEQWVEAWNGQLAQKVADAAQAIRLVLTQQSPSLGQFSGST